jgi:hypothetical protein
VAIPLRLYQGLSHAIFLELGELGAVMA